MSTSLKIDDDLERRLHEVAGRRRRSVDAVTVEAVRQYVEREEARDGFRREAEASWAAYQTDGLHLTGQDVSDWLNSWGTDGETPAPRCHR
ncbi:MAG: CopG family transcriptional regulator [Tistrella sp.]|uniref:CopG family transcriptional regulator n=1 Tax=Tistrella mobilis TaxID=171437 RepID=A0A3B9IE71_9PROT|nr:CopG family transcriptional regulator [Tistrella sp.]MAD39945.1 CopG family transcriptional regulator [Tistrella sp.]MBA77671.1 CopG family transcriptional regulator [Tistrella sp.]HAE45998.1 CopG family transcriptional regulator [Tistrella mobilis]|tara:strand:- start:409 stop:681 length:273 start_codon:yes stop_codon:yes gene_type:complete